MKTLKFISTLSMMLFVLLMAFQSVQSAQKNKQLPQISATSENMLPATLQKTTDALMVVDEGWIAVKDGTMLITTPKNLIGENYLKMEKTALSQLSDNSKANLTWNSMMTGRMNPNLVLAFNNQTNSSGMMIIDSGAGSLILFNNMMVNNAAETLQGLKLAFDSQTSVGQEIASGMMITNTTKTFENSDMLFGDMVKSMKIKQANNSSFKLISTNSDSMIGYLNSEPATLSSTLFAAYDAGIAFNGLRV